MNCIKILWLVKKEINNVIASFGMVEENRDHELDVFTTEGIGLANSELLSMFSFNCEDFCGYIPILH